MFFIGLWRFCGSRVSQEARVGLGFRWFLGFVVFRYEFGDAGVYVGVGGGVGVVVLGYDVYQSRDFIFLVEQGIFRVILREREKGVWIWQFRGFGLGVFGYCFQSVVQGLIVSRYLVYVYWRDYEGNFSSCFFGSFFWKFGLFFRMGFIMEV